MNKSDYDNPNTHAFYCNKRSFYAYDSEGNVKSAGLDRTVIEEFRTQIRAEKLGKGDHDFSDFEFTSESKKIFVGGEERLKLAFASFENAVFYDEARFEFVDFDEMTNYSGCVFKSKVLFLNVDFNGLTMFSGTKFMRGVDFKNCSFNDTRFDQINIQEFFKMGYCKFKSLVFDDVDFRRVNAILEELEAFKDHACFLEFKKSRLGEATLFSSNLSLASFIGSDFVDADFRTCAFNISSGRVIFFGDPKVLLDTKEAELVQLEIVYQQFKRNFASRHDWDMAGKFYVSEMEMRRRRQLNRFKRFVFRKPLKAVYSFLYGGVIMGFYNTFSRYTQNAVRPLYWLMALIILFAGIYLNHPEFSRGCLGIIARPDFAKYWDNALVMSIGNALPYLAKMPLDDNSFWQLMMMTERLFGTMFLAFFLVGVRNKLRQ